MSRSRMSLAFLAIAGLLTQPLLGEQGGGTPDPPAPGQGGIDSPGETFDNGDVSGGIDAGSNDGVKVTYDPESGSGTSSTTVNVKDKSGSSAGGDVSISGVDGNDTVNINGNNAHSVSITGSGGTVNVHNGDASGVVTNTSSSGNFITVNRPNHEEGNIIVSPGQVRVF